jgi:ABC-type multidrug transport system permease subunit
MAKIANPQENRLEKILAYMIAGVVGASILSLLTIIITAATGSHTLLPIVMYIPLVGFPAGFILIITLLAVNLTRRKKEGN